MKQEETKNEAQGPTEKLILNPTFRPKLSFEVRTINRPQFSRRFDVTSDPTLCQLLVDLAIHYEKDGELPDLSPGLKEILLEGGFIIPSGHAPKEVKFGFRFDLELLSLVPARSREEAKTLIQGTKIVLNPELVFQLNSNRPLGHSNIPPAECFPKETPLVWIENRGLQTWAPYQLDELWHEKIERLKNGGSLSFLSDDEVEVFIHSGVLVEEGSAEKRRSLELEKIRQANEHLKAKRYAILRNVLSPLQIANLRKYYRDMRAQGILEAEPDARLPLKRLVKHNENVTVFIHRQIAELIRGVTGECLIPSYSFVSAYNEGAELEKHVDRPQCVWNCSLLADWEPEGKTERSWPIFLEVNKQKEACHLDLGSLVLYQGTELFHWRDKLPEHETQTLLLFHFVPFNFMGDLK